MYDISIRQKVLSLLTNGKTQEEVSEFLNISIRTIQRWLRCEKLGESLKPKTNNPRQRKIDKDALLKYVKEFPDKTLKEMGVVFGVAHSSIDRMLKKFSITLKKTTLYKERKEKARVEFLKQVQLISKEKIAYIDEAGVDNRLFREKGQALRVCKSH
jgi:transposase